MGFRACQETLKPASQRFEVAAGFNLEAFVYFGLSWSGLSPQEEVGGLVWGLGFRVWGLGFTGRRGGGTKHASSS